MDDCRNCEIKDETIRRQEIVINQLQEQVDEYRGSVKRLEEAMRTMCEYAEVCEHFPGKDLLEEARA